MADLHGTDAPDRLIGTENDDSISGFSGYWENGPPGDNDTLRGLAGNDTFVGGIGSDLLFGGKGDDEFSALGNIIFSYDTLYGGAGDDRFALGVGRGRGDFHGGDGIDLILVMADSNQAIELDLSNPAVAFVLSDGSSIVEVERLHLSGSYQHDHILAGNFDDSLFGYDGADWLHGGAGNDILESWGTGSTELRGGRGDDLVNFQITDGQALSRIAGGSGRDTLHLQFDLAVSCQISADGSGNAQLVGEATQIVGFEILDVHFWASPGHFVRGGRFDDTISAEGTGDTLVGGAGNDLLREAGEGNQICGRAGDDDIEVYGRDNGVLGGDGNDTIFAHADRLDLSTISGGAGTDLLRLDASILDSGIILDLSQAQTIANGMRILGFESLHFIGGSGNDTVLGNSDDCTLEGGLGDDLLQGGSGNDILDASQGFDTLFGGEGDDLLSGRTDSSAPPGMVAHLDGGDGTDLLQIDLGDLGAGLALSLTDPGTAVALAGLTFVNLERLDLWATHFADTITGGVFGDSINGAGGADWIDGLGGDDTLDGGLGDDLLFGGGGNDLFISRHPGIDRVNGGKGNDEIVLTSGSAAVFTGGESSDVMRVYFYQPPSARTRFRDLSADDRIVLQVSWDEDNSQVLSTDAFVIGTAAGDADDRVLYDPFSGRLRYDSDGNGAAAAVVFLTLDPGTDVTATNFLLG